MKIFVSICLTAFLAYVIGVYSALPWWSFAVTSLVIPMAIPQKPSRAFLTGFLGVFLLWVTLAFVKDLANEHILSAKVALILPMGGSYIALILLSGILGGLVSGLAALTGTYLRKSN